ncbi:hypothetical protein DCAR_0101052 [Daucus carota subsp. sativus]|uniref:Uncharacterized protein n=1 Tax=Daucus carota subsp. sativus TaxID=79200 RepID=A0AAF0W4D1_DAUCS|nr:hypothetical protein DCAR_0101052 [Daucus carota subsp. sativus]
MEREDFTFPITKTKNNTKLSVDSEPWWCVTYSSSSLKNSETNQEENSNMKAGLKVGNAEDDMENMDLLWEDFNDKTICRSCGVLAEPDMASRRMTGLGCSGAFKMVKLKAEGGKKTSAGVLIKLVKKLLLHNNQT